MLEEWARLTNLCMIILLSQPLLWNRDPRSSTGAKIEAGGVGLNVGVGVLAGTTRFDLGLSGSSWVLSRAAAGMMVSKGCWKG